MPVWLWICIWILIILVLAAVILLSSVATFRVHIKKQGQDEEIMVDVKLAFGLIKLHYEVPKIRFDSLKKGFKVSSKSHSNLNGQEGEMREAHIGTEKVQNWAHSYKRILRATLGLRKWGDRTLSHVSITRLSWSTTFAFREADYTAVTSGLIWAIKSFLVGGLSFRVNMRSDPKLSVRPLFGVAPQFATEMICIAKISLGYAMYAGLTLIVRVLKVKGGIKQWLNILFKA